MILVLVSVVLALAVLSLARQRLRGHVRLERELEQLVRERTEQIRDLSLRDPLTGLRNRRFVVELMRSRGQPLIRPGVEQRRGLARTGFGIVMVDLDEFKHVNDTYGHESGDMVLQECAATWWWRRRPGSRRTRLGATPARLGAL